MGKFKDKAIEEADLGEEIGKLEDQTEDYVEEVEECADNSEDATSVFVWLLRVFKEALL